MSVAALGEQPGQLRFSKDLVCQNYVKQMAATLMDMIHIFFLLGRERAANSCIMTSENPSMALVGFAAHDSWTREILICFIRGFGLF